MDLLREDVDVAFRITRRLPQDWVAKPVLPFAVCAYAKPRRGLPLRHPDALAAHTGLVLGQPADSVTMRWQHSSGATQRSSCCRPAPATTSPRWC